MKSSAPWSVKGIERDARETAKAAAQREGLTVGEWLNQIIYTASDPSAATTTGEIEGLKARDLAVAIEHLNRKIAGAEAKGSDALETLARSLGGVVERLQRLERTRPSEGGAAPDLSDRLEAIEAKSNDRTRIEALRALEKAVGQVAVQFNTAHQSSLLRLDAVERRLEAVGERLDDPDADFGAISADTVRSAFESMAERIARAEKIAQEAASIRTEAAESIDTDFVQKTGIRLRILGDEIKRGGDQIRALEGSIARLSQQIDAAEKRSAEGVEKVAETIADLRDQFASTDMADQASARAEIEAAVTEITQRTEDRISALQRSFDEMVRRLDAAAEGGGRPAAQFQPAQPQTAHIQTVEPRIAQPLKAQPLMAEPAPQIARAPAAPTDSLEAELDEAFASIELEEPAPVPAPPHAAQAQPQADETDDFLDETAAESGVDLDDFSFDLDAESFADAPEVTKPEFDAETSDVLAEIREAFGIDPPKPHVGDDDHEDAAEGGLEDEAAAPDLSDDIPPLVDPAGAAKFSAPAPSSQEDYLRAARRAAREAAARAAAEAETETATKRKLTPKQRAILAAKLKRRKLEEARAAGLEAPAQSAPAATRPQPDKEDAQSIKARVLAALEKMKARGGAKQKEEPVRDPAEDGAPAVADANPSLLGGLTAAVARLRAAPMSSGVIGLGVGIVLLLAALVFFTRDLMLRPGAEKADAAPATIAAPAADAPAVRDGALEDDAIRPRDLYLENIAVLKAAQTDIEAKAALKKIEEAAALGHPPAQLQLGELYKIGQLYPKDLANARLWFERAANGGNVLAMHRLGVMSARGEGGPVDARLSIEWFEKAAAFGLLDSQYNLGATYHPAPGAAAGGVQNAALAYFWYAVAAKNGDSQAGEMAAGLGATLAPAEKAARDAEVAAWAARTADPIANEVVAAS